MFFLRYIFFCFWLCLTKGLLIPSKTKNLEDHKWPKIDFEKSQNKMKSGQVQLRAGQIQNHGKQVPRSRVLLVGKDRHWDLNYNN